MTTSDDRAGQLNRALVGLHRAVLATLAACALVILVGGLPELDRQPPPLDRLWTVAALGLATGSILTRRASIAPTSHARSFATWSIASLLLAACLGLLGVAVTRGEDRGATGLFYTLAGFLLSARPPYPLRTGAAGKE